MKLARTHLADPPVFLCRGRGTCKALPAGADERR